MLSIYSGNSSKRWMMVVMIINSHDIALDISLIHSKLCWSVERSELYGALSQEYLKARNSMLQSNDFQKVWLLPVIRDVFRNVDDCDILKHDFEPRYIQSWRDLIVHLVSKDLDGINVVLPVDFRFKELPPQKIIHCHQSPTL